jgi:hypothetical protein
MELMLDMPQRGKCCKALARLKKVTETAKSGYSKASLEAAEAETQIGFINGAQTAFDQSPEGEKVKLNDKHRHVVWLGLGLLKGDVAQTESRGVGLGIVEEPFQDCIGEYDALLNEFAEQTVLPETNGKASKSDKELVGRMRGKKGKRETAGAR